MYYSMCAHYDGYSSELGNSYCPECQGAMLGSSIQFLRCGAAPKSGYSWNNEINDHEAGLSVFLLEGDTVAWTHDAETFWDRPWYLGTGRVVGFGGPQSSVRYKASLEERLVDTDREGDR